MQLEQGEYTKTHTTGGRPSFRATSGAAPAFRLHARRLVVLFAATACLAPAAPVLAQHPAQHGASAQGAAKTRAADDEAIRPFPINVREEALVDLRRRIAATRWPDQETVADRSQGVPLAKIQELVRYWGTDYDWRKAEAKLNALPLIMTRGWPGSVFELLKVIGPLTDPTAHGGVAEDAFDLVLPSMPGYGFSEKPKTTSWGPDRIARAWDVLMKRLGYTRYVSQGGDWGAVIADVMARQAPPGLLGLHVNRLDRSATIPPEVAKALNNGDPAPTDLTAEERAVFDQIKDFSKKGTGYSAMMGTRPQTIGYSLANSPVGLAAWCYDKFADWVFTRGAPERSLTRDEMLDDITLYWLTHTGTSGARLYWANNANPNAVDISIPAAVTVFLERSTRRRRAGRSGPTTSSSTITAWTKAATSRPGNSRSSSLRRAARRSDRSANRGRQP